MSERPNLSKRVPRPAAQLTAVTTGAFPVAESNAEVEALQRQVRELEERNAEVEALQRQVRTEAQAAKRKLADAAKVATLEERSYAGTMKRPHTKADGMSYRRTTLSIPEGLDKAIDYYIKSTGGQWRDRSSFLKFAAEEFLRGHPLKEDAKTPVDSYLASLPKS